MPEPAMLLQGATVVTFDPPSADQADLRVQGDRIVERGPSLAAHPGEEALDLGGAVVMPGFVNAHTHLYSALARGMPPPKTAPKTFLEILERVWWRLDRALDEEAVYVSGLVGGIEAVLSGTTLLVDHHSSPSFIRGSLGTLRRSLEEVGLRSVLCYEVTDRNGREGRDLGIEENRDFVAGGAAALTRGMFGAHASFTLSEETLGQIAAASGASAAGLHLHVAEDKIDVDHCRSAHGCSLPERLDRHGLLGPRALLAHCVHLAPEEAAGVQARGAWIAHNPRSNMNNAVGYAPVEALKRAALGTDGIDQDMLAETRGAYLKMREAGRADAAAAALGLLVGGHRLASELLGLPFGRLAAGAPADLVVLEYRPPTPLSAENLVGHLLFGMDRSHVASVMVAGRFVVREGRVAGVDVLAASEQARRVAREVWSRMDRLS